MDVKTIDEVEGLSRLTQNAKSVILKAYDLARYEIVPTSKNTVRVEHLFCSLLLEKRGVAFKVLKRIGIDVDKLIIDIIKPRGTNPLNVEISEEFNETIFTSFVEANSFGHVYVGSEHLLLAVFKNSRIPIIKRLYGEGLSYEVIRGAILSMGNYHPGVFSSMPSDSTDAKGALDFFTRDMNDMAKEGKYLPVFGRQDEIDRLIHILSRKNKNNPVLIGDAGVGKTAIVEGLVQKILSGDVPDSMSNYRVIQLDLAIILAGAKIRGDVEERLLAVIDELRKDQNKVVFIDEIHMIIGAGTAGSGGGMDVANLLKPHLTSGDIKVIGATTFDEYQKYFEDDNALTRRFQPIKVEEISKADSKSLLKYVKKEYEKFHQIKITDESLDEAVELSARYITDRYLPDKALDVIDEAAAKKKLGQKSILQSSILNRELDALRREKAKSLRDENYEKALEIREKETLLLGRISQERSKLKEKRSKSSIGKEDIKEVVSRMTGIPLTTMQENDKEALKNIHESFAKRIIGQDDALRVVTNALKRARVGLMDENRPLASFLFLGPTGVGKTETAKVIAKYLFGDEDAIIQLNMSEFMEQHSVSKIIGSPPGYVGYADGGHITEEVRRKPYSVVLFDEMEKAHPDTLNLLLQILEEGQIKDSKGRNVNFRNTIIIMTSNIGAEEIAKDDVLGFDMQVQDEKPGQMDVAYKTMKEKLMVELKAQMRPEFLNRIDDIVIFKGLDKKDAKMITRILLNNLRKRIKKYKIDIDVSAKVVNMIVEKGFSAEYGARNLRRKIQEILETELSEMILNGEIDPEKKNRVEVEMGKDESLSFVVSS